jgi:hypothetical protein
MPRWINRPLTLFHGTDTSKIASYAPFGQYSTLTGFRVQLALCRPNTDFGQGFYATTWEHQARQWANERAQKSQLTGPAVAVVLSFSVSRDRLADLENLCFVRADNDYWDLVIDCRQHGFPPHQRTAPGKNRAYDVVYGPVSLWAQRLTIHAADQVSFHTRAGVTVLPPPLVYDIAQSTTGLFP